MNRKKIYISGAISGLPENEVAEKFERVSLKLSKLGFSPVVPLENGLPKDASYEEHILRDLEMLSECDFIYFCSDWERSNGCRIEYYFARATGITMMFEE